MLVSISLGLALSASAPQTSVGLDRPNEINAMAFSSDGSTLFLGASDGIVRAVDTKTWTLIRCYHRPGSNKAETPRELGNNKIHFIVLSPDGRRIAGTREGLATSIDVFETASGSVLFTSKSKVMRPCFTDSALYFNRAEEVDGSSLFPFVKYDFAAKRLSLFRDFPYLPPEKRAGAIMDSAKSMWIVGDRLLSVNSVGFHSYKLDDAQDVKPFPFGAKSAGESGFQLDVDSKGRYCAIDDAGSFSVGITPDAVARRLGSVATIESGRTLYSGTCGFLDGKRAYTSAVLSHDSGQRLNIERGDFKIWDVDTGKVELTLMPEAKGGCDSVAVTGVCGLIAMSYGARPERGVVDLYELSSGKRIIRLSTTYAESTSAVRVAMRRL